MGKIVRDRDSKEITKPFNLIGTKTLKAIVKDSNNKEVVLRDAPVIYTAKATGFYESPTGTKLLDSTGNPVKTWSVTTRSTGDNNIYVQSVYGIPGTTVWYVRDSGRSVFAGTKEVATMKIDKYTKFKFSEVHKWGDGYNGAGGFNAPTSAMVEVDPLNPTRLKVTDLTTNAVQTINVGDHKIILQTGFSASFQQIWISNLGNGLFGVHFGGGNSQPTSVTMMLLSVEVI